MSDKTFLQQLDSIKRKVESLHNEFIDLDMGGDHLKQLVDIQDNIQRMINQCIEIQLAVMKQQGING